MSARVRRQRGQALVEFIVMALVLVPLFLLLPMIAKYQDMAHATEMASRYVAFEAMTRNADTPDGFKPPAQLSAEVARRFFSNADAAIKTNDVAGDFAANRKPFWVDQHGDPLIQQFGRDVSVSFGESNGTSHNDAWIAAHDGRPFEFNLLNVRDKLGLPAPGLYRANVSIRVADLPSVAGSWTQAYDTFNHIGLVMTRSTTVLVDAWGARDPQQVEQRIGDIALTPGSEFGPGRALHPAKQVLDVAVGAVELPKTFPGMCTSDCGPKLGELDFWRDDVPADRLR